MTVFAISNKEQLGYSAETTWGTTVGANPIKLLRYVSNTFKPDTSSVVSKEIINSREVSDIIRTKVRGAGSFPIEWSAGAFDDMMQGVMQGTWSTNVLQVGTTFQSFTFERQFTDITQFAAYKGAIVSELTVNAAIGKVLDGQISFSSKAPVYSGTTSGTGTTAATANSVMDPISSIQLTNENGTPMTGVTDFSINIKQAIVDLEQLSSVDPVLLTPGQLQVSGTFSIYFADATIIGRHLNWTADSLEFKIGGSSSHNYDFLIGACRLTTLDTPNPGMNQPLMLKFGFQGYKSGTTTLQITRAP